MLLREVNIIKARLQEKQEELSRREEWIKGGDLSAKLFRMEKDLFKSQDDLDRQKIKLAERVAKLDSVETEFYKKQDELNLSIYKLKDDIEGLLASLK